jgi:hypothetical protein
MAINEGVSSDAIVVNNRWRRMYQASGASYPALYVKTLHRHQPCIEALAQILKSTLIKALQIVRVQFEATIIDSMLKVVFSRTSYVMGLVYPC